MGRRSVVALWLGLAALESACSERSIPTAPLPAASPLAAPTPLPAPTPAPEPTPTPCTAGLCEAPTTNTNPPVRLTLRLYFVTNDSGIFVPGFTEQDEIPVGYRVTIDATAKDKENQDTLGSGTVSFFFSDTGLAKIGGSHTHQRRLTVLKAGTLDCWAELDGVMSNVLQLKFKN